MVENINPGSGFSAPASLTVVNGELFFAADDGTNGTELWKSDGTSVGTVMVENINPGANSSLPDQLMDVNGILYFRANDGANGTELWKSDGMPGGTILVKDIRPGALSSFPSALTNINGTLLFSANNGTSGSELWKSDGTPGGTVLVKDINPGGGSSSPHSMINLAGTLYFSANDFVTFTELWKSDGTEAGTVMVADIHPTGHANTLLLTQVGGTLFFRADDGTNGTELWKLEVPAVQNDFDGNCNSDLLQVNTVSGAIASNFIDDGSPLGSSGTILTADPAAGWVVNATGDFNNDKNADLLLYNTITGDIRMVWLDGSTILSDTVVMTVNPASGIVPLGTGDFDGDGITEIILHDASTGLVVFIILDGSTVLSEVRPINQIDVAGGWTINNTGDFDGDGDTDFLLYNTTNGNIMIMEMEDNGVTGFTGVMVLDPATGWEVKDTGDFNGDGKTDLMILNAATNVIAVILLDGATIDSTFPLTGPPSHWEVVNVGQYNNDGEADLLIQDTITGDAIIGLQSGGTITSFTGVTNVDLAGGWTLHSGKP